MVGDKRVSEEVDVKETEDRNNATMKQPSPNDTALAQRARR